MTDEFWKITNKLIKGTLFLLTNAVCLHLKFHELVPVVENKDPHRLHARLEQTPSESHIQNSTIQKNIT